MSAQRTWQQLQRAKAVLGKAEWRGEGGHWEEAACVCCGGSPYFPSFRGNSHPTRRGHGEVCELANLLEELGVPQDEKV